MHQNFHSDIAEKYAHLKPHFHNTETMGAVHHALSRRPLSSGAYSDTINIFPTAITTSGTLVFL